MHIHRRPKGEIERLFATLQDRLVKELRLRGISIDTRSEHISEKSYWADFNKRFRSKFRTKKTFIGLLLRV